VLVSTEAVLSTLQPVAARARAKAAARRSRLGVREGVSVMAATVADRAAAALRPRGRGRRGSAVREERAHAAMEASGTLAGMRGALVAIVVLGCSGSAKQETAPSPAVREPAPAVAPGEPSPATAAAPAPTPAPAPASPPSSAEATALVEPAPGGGRPATRRSGPETQAEIAARLAGEGKQATLNGDYALATRKFKEAVARVPEPTYFFNLCLSQYLEGHFGESLTACNAADRTNPPPLLKQKIDKLRAKILDEAKRQEIKVQP
jgi:hypothetical protein